MCGWRLRSTMQKVAGMEHSNNLVARRSRFRKPLAGATILCGFLAALWLAETAAAQSQPGRILTVVSNNVIECNIDATNCFTVVTNISSNTNGIGYTQATSPSVATN